MALVTTLLAPSSSTFSGDITASGLIIDGIQLLFKASTLSNANVTGMYAAPIEIIAAAGAGKAIIIHNFFLQHEFDTGAFTGGGAVILQYANTANGAGVQACEALSSSIFTTAANGGQMQAGQLPYGAATAYDNVGLFVSNNTDAFATGAGTAIYRIWYSTIDV